MTYGVLDVKLITQINKVSNIMSTKAIQINIGDKYNRWKVASEVFYKTFPNGSKAKFVECVCECGTISVLRAAALTSPTKPSISCGCYRIEQTSLLNTVKLDVGGVFGKLTILENLGMEVTGSSKRNMVLVSCGCGSRPFKTRVDGIKDGNTQSCGCLQREAVSLTMTTHGMSNTSAYSSWQKLRYRCDNPKDPRWDRYGGRGVTYPEVWNTFEGFWEDMSDGWFEGADIDRIDFDMSYSKENCRWENRDVGNHNKSKPEDCTSIYKGVYYDKARDKWVARLNRNGIIYLQKRFNTAIEAAFAYDEVSEAIYGDRPNKTISGIFP